jgi:AcrR family transcriptional regulator
MKSPARYHHGALREALLSAAETILRRDGLSALSLRAIAREAGVSHGAPAHHFADLSALLSDLAAVGFERLAEQMRTAGDRNAMIGRAYVAFAIANPALFTLMFRSERLDGDRASLREARGKAFAVLAGIGKAPAETGRDAPNPRQLGAMVRAWSLAHGFATLAIDGRLAPLLVLAPQEAGMELLLDATFSAFAAKWPPEPGQ